MSQVVLKSKGNDFYFIKDNIIVDKTCPQCKKLLLDDKTFCRCGFFLRAEKVSKFWTKMLSVWLFIGIIFIAVMVGIQNTNDYMKAKFKDQKMNFSSVAPVNVQMLISLKASSYLDYIQNIYQKPQEENKLTVLIKPGLWEVLTKNERKDILNLVQTNWNEVYRKNYENTGKKPEVSFANPE